MYECPECGAPYDFEEEANACAWDDFEYGQGDAWPYR